MSRSTPQLGLIGGLVLLATSLLGSSVFVVPALGVQLAGSSSLISWLLLMGFMLPMAFVFAGLGRSYPHSGGVSHWAGRAMGPRAEWVCAMTLVSVIPVGLPAALLLTMVFLNRLIPLDAPYDLLAQLAVLCTAYALNRAGLRASAMVQTLIIVGTLLFIASLAWTTPLSVPAMIPVYEADKLIPIIGAAGLMLWCFLGLEIVANLAEEFRNPTRDIPLVVIGGILIAGLVYYLCASIVLSAGFDSVGADSLLSLANQRMGGIGVTLLSVFGFLACFASLNTYLSGFSRGLWSLADECKLPGYFAQRSDRQVPVRVLNAILGVCSVSTLVFYLDWLDLAQLITLANAHFILVYLAAMLAAVRLLQGTGRWIGIAGATACVLGFMALGWGTLYGLLVLAALWAVAPKQVSSAPRG